jgi:hypothetical protein
MISVACEKCGNPIGSREPRHRVGYEGGNPVYIHAAPKGGPLRQCHDTAMKRYRGDRRQTITYFGESKQKG